MRDEAFRLEDFDDWAELARSDPDRFERRRQAVIDRFIDSAPESRRSYLRQLQWRIDMERKRAPNPTAACVRLYDMMWDAFAGERGLATLLRDGVNGDGPSVSRSAKVLRFPEQRSAERGRSSRP
jgi:hypothetical protein